VTAELNTHLENLVSTPQKKVGRKLHKSNIHGRAANAEPLITENNAKRRKIGCVDHKTRTSDGWKYVIWSEESYFTLFPISGRVYVWRTPKKIHNPEYLVPTVKNGRRSMKIWATIFWYYAGPLFTMNGQIIASDSVDILGKRLHPMAHMLIPNNDAIIQDDNSPIHTARSVQSRFEEHEVAFQHLSWPA
jgi:hypothetical protein